MLSMLRGAKKPAQGQGDGKGDPFDNNGGHDEQDSLAPMASASQLADKATNRLYNPYDGLNSRIDPFTLDTLYHVPTSAEYVFKEEAMRRRRTWSDNMAFYTACGWVGGGMAGTAYGILEGSRIPEGLHLDTTRLRINRYINCMGHRARTAANAMGVLGMMFGLGESALKELGDTYVRVEYPEALETMAAGAITGALFRSPRGPRQMVVAAGLGATAAGLLCGVRTFAKWA